MNRFRTTACSLLLLLPVCSQAGHHARVSHHSPNFPQAYLFGGVSSSEFEFKQGDYRYSFGDGSQSDIEINRDSTGVRFVVGVPVTRSLAFEIGYIGLGELATEAYSDGSKSLQGGFAPGPVRTEGDVSGGVLGLRLSTPRSAPVGFFTRFGLYAWQYDGILEDTQQRGRFTVEGSDAYIGLGLRVAMADNADVQLCYDYYPLESDDRSMDFGADSLSMDFVLRF